ncbi:MAG: cob(I)yrinic acid a,c-diamide adenosyltransferase [bacterium]
MKKSLKGLTIVYVGQGKGKTTAAVGLAVRARGWGQRVLFLQFIKEAKWPSGERAMLKKLGVHVWVMGQGFVRILNDQKPFTVHKQAARQALKKAQEAIRGKYYDVVILDEAISAIEERLITQTDIVRLITKKRPKITLVLTGHTVYPMIMKKADLITNMKKIKHPFDNGIMAKKGIDF